MKIFSLLDFLIFFLLIYRSTYSILLMISYAGLYIRERKDLPGSAGIAGKFR